MRVLITGASGFIGGALMRRFGSRPDIELVGVARRALTLANYRSIDLSEPFDLDYRPDVVIHAAALASPWARRDEYLRHNVIATRNVIEFCRTHGRPRLLYLSSSSVFYRDEHQFDITEQTPIGPAFINDYAATKYAGEELVRGYDGEQVVLRPRAVFGPGDTVLFPRILTAARRRRLPRLVAQDGAARGDLIYIDSLCDYIMAAASRPVVAAAYNLTNAQPVVIQDFLNDILARLGVPLPDKPVRVKTAMRAAAWLERVYRLLPFLGEPPATRFGVSVFAYSKTFDVRLALRDFGPPSVSLAEGVDRFVAWQRGQWA
jgi:nucleoside-diphosphate-sugar epimerase